MGSCLSLLLVVSVWNTRGESGDACSPGLCASERGVLAGVGWGSGLWAGCRARPQRCHLPSALFLVGGESGAGSRVTAQEPPLSLLLSLFLVSPKPSPGNLGWSGPGGVVRGGAEPSWCRQGFVVWVSCLRYHGSRYEPCGSECKVLKDHLATSSPGLLASSFLGQPVALQELRGLVRRLQNIASLLTPL